MTRIAAASAADLRFRQGDTGPIRAQKLEILRGAVLEALAGGGESLILSLDGGDATSSGTAGIVIDGGTA